MALSQAHVVLAVSEPYLEITARSRAEMVGRFVYELSTPTAPAKQERNEWLRRALDAATSTRLVRSPEYHQDFGLDENGFAIVKVWALEVQRVRANVAEEDILIVRLLDNSEAREARDRDQRARAQLRSTAQLRAILVEEAREEAMNERAQLDEVLAFANIGAWRLDEETGVVTCTAQCRQNLGITDAGLVTKYDLFHSFIHPRDRASVQDAMNQAVADKTFFETEYRAMWHDGSTHWIMLRGKGRYDDKGDLSSLHGFTLDITARKEAELRQATEAQVEKEARVASDYRVSAMDSFLSAVSHEIRTPLNAILSWSQITRRTTSPQSIARASETIERNARQLASMVDDLLDTGALAHGGVEMRHEVVDFGAVVAAAVEDFRVQFLEKGLVLRGEDVASLAVSGDETRLRQIVYNLLSNALKYTETGSVTVSLTDEGDVVKLRVVDSGVGIREDLLPKIFDKFEQASRERSGRVGGLGLGLWLVKSLTELHGGTVAVYSDGEGLGAAFEVCLPALHSRF
ncbi:PAS domain-containing sensor histidine kinase [Robbsia sp. KACC 23696]|uniref:sensor histidine kinase n=1 Tax=Robbsia sp. KACC 23696 TaxID=3149231 RepID=UPI00325AD5B7